MKANNLRQEFTARAVHLRDAFSGHLTDSFVEGACAELEAQQVVLDAMFNLFDERGLGAIYRDRYQQYGFVLADAGQEGAFRYQLFDKRGFFGHSTHDTADEAIVELCANGYVELQPDDTLAIMSQTRDWKFGTEKLAVRTALEMGRKTWQQAEREYADLELKYDPDLWVA
ncbi:hypothetical protein ACI77O_12910 [Pseudomonas tritici]|uniref:hypothetical protein n=1 Tax=Pseudomonas tritici TaxID=2745518 RepID=UPI00387ADA4A